LLFEKKSETAEPSRTVDPSPLPGHALSNDQPTKSQDFLPLSATIAKLIVFEKTVNAPADMLPFWENLDALNRV
jgi:hypothetical protein